MSSRYRNANIIKNNNNKRRLSTLIIPNVPFSNNDIYIQTTTHERLDKLAKSIYGDETLWWVIAGANKLGKGTLSVPQGTRLRIPPTDNIQDLIKQEKNNR